MIQTLLLLPTTAGVGLNVVAQGLVRAIEFQGRKVRLYKPIHTNQAINQDADHPAGSIPIETVEKMVDSGRVDELLNDIMAGFEHYAQDVDVVIVQGINDVSRYTFSQDINTEISRALDANIIFIASPTKQDPKALVDQIISARHSYRAIGSSRILGLIINKINAPIDEKGNIILTIDPDNKTIDAVPFMNTLKKDSRLEAAGLSLIAHIPWKINLIMPRTKDIAKLVNAKIVYPGEIEKRRVSRIKLCARNVANIVSLLQPETLIITPIDRDDVIIATCLAALSGIKIAGLLLTGTASLPSETLSLCEQAFSSGLPLLRTKTDSFQTSLMLNNMYFETPLDDEVHIEEVRDFMASHMADTLIKTLLTQHGAPQLSPAAFRYRVTQKAKQLKKTILLPEGKDIRILQAASICVERGIASFLLLGDENEMKRVAKNNNIAWHPDMRVINPEQCRDNYINKLVELRRHKQMTPPAARALLKDDVVLAMLMLSSDEADGVVSGVINTTANTIRPALQIIKTNPQFTIVSSVFFMCMKDQVLIYGDCAINPNPNAEQLAEIAIQSAETATQFGIDPVIAMISYSTGTSGTGVDVDKIRKAKELAQQQRPDLLIDGPLQYDAALIKNVAVKKAPESHVAGKATVIIFPDLNTGNTTYKAVQRSANILSIGPVLQGLNKPVNDLSRGATVADIVYTIAITAIQADKEMRKDKGSVTS